MLTHQRAQRESFGEIQPPPRRAHTPPKMLIAVIVLFSFACVYDIASRSICGSSRSGYKVAQILKYEYDPSAAFVNNIKEPESKHPKLTNKHTTHESEHVSKHMYYTLKHG